MDRALCLNKLEYPSTNDAKCQVWLKLAQWFWRRRFFNFVNVFWLFWNYLPLEKGRALHLNKLESPLPKDALCQVWLIFAQLFWRRRWKCNDEQQRRRQWRRRTTDKFWSEKFTWAFSLGELKMILLTIFVTGILCPLHSIIKCSQHHLYCLFPFGLIG